MLIVKDAFLVQVSEPLDRWELRSELNGPAVAAGSWPACVAAERLLDIRVHLEIPLRVYLLEVPKEMVA